MTALLKNLEIQLRKKGIENPAALPASKATLLSDTHWNKVAGAGDPVVYFLQVFDQVHSVASPAVIKGPCA